MKKILYGLCILLSTASFAASPTVDEKVSTRFNQTFPNAVNVKWYEYATFYEVVFLNNGISCMLKYDLQGNVLSLRRDYYEKDLPLFIKAKLKLNYEKKRIFGITEITTDDAISYTIILEDEKHWITVKSNENGSMSIVQKLKKT